jgi:hypothetical protein
MRPPPPPAPGVPPPRPRVAPPAIVQHVGPGEIPQVHPPKVDLPLVVAKRGV